jgi:hypothetical protein
LIGSLGGAQGAEAGGAGGFELGMLVALGNHWKVPAPLVVVGSTAAGAAAGDAYYRYRLANPTGPATTAPVKPSDQSRDEAIGAGAGAIVGFAQVALAGSAKFGRLPPIVRALTHLRFDAIGRRLGAAW